MSLRLLELPTIGMVGFVHFIVIDKVDFTSCLDADSVVKLTFACGHMVMEVLSPSRFAIGCFRPMNRHMKHSDLTVKPSDFSLGLVKNEYLGTLPFT
jgi:hypothetical protein